MNESPSQDVAPAAPATGRRNPLLLVCASVGTIALLWLLAGSDLPLGLVGEWVWNRVPASPPPARYVEPVIALAGYLVLVRFGWGILSRRSKWWSLPLIPMLIVAGGGVQALCLDLPMPPYGPERGPLALHAHGSSGYFIIATNLEAVADPSPPRADSRQPDGPVMDPTRAFLERYESWIATQDSFHIGTHPPGLILLNRGLLNWFADHPTWIAPMVGFMPRRFREGLSQLARGHGLAPNGQGTLAAVAALAFAGGLVTLAPIYLLIRLTESPAVAWLGASFWPLVPAVPLFLPIADCLYPLLAVSTVALLSWSMQIRSSFLAVLGGLAFWVGMMASLAFLALTPILVGTLFAEKLRPEGVSRRRLALTTAAFAAGFALPCAWFWLDFHVNLPAVWRENLSKHSGFYDAMPRSYWPWIGLNLIEFAAVLGPTLACLSMAPLLRCRIGWPPSRLAVVHGCWFATVIALDLSGRNLSEVGRLWIFLTPFACVGAARTFSAKPPRRWMMILWLALQSLALLALVAHVEPLLPVSLAT